MATPQQFKDLALRRLDEAEALFAVGFYDGAKYLAGYAVELALKARICRLLEVDEYPDTGALKRVYAVHDLDQLLLLAGLSKVMNPENQPLFACWSTAVQWNPENRYDAVGTVTQREAEESLDAIRHSTKGVLTWLKTVW